jgi:hypothetical protein
MKPVGRAMNRAMTGRSLSGTQLKIPTLNKSSHNKVRLLLFPSQDKQQVSKALWLVLHQLTPMTRKLKEKNEAMHRLSIATPHVMGRG